MIHLSPSAIQEINRLRNLQPSPPLFFRLGVTSGTCAPLAYTFGFTQSTLPTDEILPCDTFRVVIDKAHLPYLDQAQVDFSEDLMGGAFRVDNPQALETCQCGNAFAAKPQESFDELP
jgi:iron-sulfur cluster assembly protein